jgi:hypothetical protein
LTMNSGVRGSPAPLWIQLAKRIFEQERSAAPLGEQLSIVRLPTTDVIGDIRIAESGIIHRHDPRSRTEKYLHLIYAINLNEARIKKIFLGRD